MNSTSSEFIFANAQALWLLPGIALLFPLLRRALHRRREILRLLGLVSRTRGSLALLISILVFLLMVVALARPSTGFDEIELPTPKADILVALDVSQSMLCADTTPTRAEAAKRKTLDLLTALKQRGTYHRVGLLLFAGEALLYAPLTQDYDVLKMYLKALGPNLIQAQGSSLSEVLDVARESFVSVGARFGHLLLFTDGEDDRATPQELTSAVAPFMRIHAIGFGTPEGAPVPDQRGRFIRDKNGRPVVSKLAESTLKELAKDTDGVYVRATPTDQDLAAILVNIDKSLGVEGGRKEPVRMYRELAPYALWASLFLLLLGAMRKKWFPAVALILGILLAAEMSELSAQELEEQSPQVGYEKFLAGEYKEASKIFERALQADAQNQRLKNALAASRYKEGDYARAAELYGALVNESKDGRSKFEALYNLGNAEVRRGNLEEGIKRYSEALKIKPEDEMTEHNRKFAEKMLQEREQQKSPAPQPAAAPSSAPSAATSPPVSPSGKPSGTVFPSVSPSVSPSWSPSGAPEASPSALSSGSPSPSSDSSPRPSQSPATNDSPKPPSSPAPKPTTAPQTSPDPSTTVPPVASPESSDSPPPPNGTANPQLSPSAVAGTPEGLSTPPPGTGTPTPSMASGSGTPTASATSRGGAERKETPTPALPSTPTEGPAFAATATDKDSNNRSPVKDTLHEYDPKELAKEEANAWLRSLPEAPLLLRRKSAHNRPQTEQTW